MRHPPSGLLVAGAALATLWGALYGGFVYDDEPLFLRNPAVTSGQLDQVVSEPLWGVGAPVGYWRPLTSLLLAAGVRLTGGEPWLLHAMSLVIHLLAAWTVVGLARDLLGSERAAGLCGLLFAVHPAHVESVAWMSAINDPASGLCVLQSLRGLVRWQRGQSDRLWPAYLWWLLGLLCKETALVALPLGVLAHFVLRQRRDRGSWRTLMPCALILVLVFAARVAVFGEAGGGLVRHEEHGIAPLTVVLLRFSLFAEYLARLTFRFGTDLMPAARLAAGTPEVVGAIVTLLFAGLCILTHRRLGRVALFGLLVIPIALLPPLSGAGGAGPYALADRYLYLSCFGLALAAAALLDRLGRVGTAVGLLAGLGLGVASAVNVGNWRDDITLFEAALAHNPDSINSRYLLGRALLARAAAPGGTRDDLRAARAHLDHAQHLMRNRDQLARTRPVDLEVALAWCRLYEVQAGVAPLADAERLLAALVRDHPEQAEARIGLAAVRWQQGDAAAAERELRAVLEREPDHAEARHDLGLLLLRRGDPQAAVRELSASLETHPYRLATRRLLAGAHGQLAVVLGRRGQADAALAEVDRAIGLLPDTAGPSWLQRAKLAVAFERWSEAETSFGRAVEAMPDSFEAAYGLGSLLVARGRQRDALPFLERALELHPQRQRSDAPAPVGLTELERTVEKLRG